MLQNPATTPCVPCYSGCSYCFTNALEGCTKKDPFTFALNFASFGLPLTVQTDRLICYRQPLPTLSCDPLTPILGSLNPDVNGLVHPNLGQCYILLQTQWPIVVLYFGKVFEHFTPPTATEAEVYELKTVLWLWILQFNPSTMKTDPDWVALEAVFNDAAINWAGLLAWGGATPGYLAGGSTHSFPTGLTPSAWELKLFNSFSTVCNANSCGYGPQCLLVAPGSNCAV